MSQRSDGRPVTSHDVARLAGVSQPTVSRALRKLPGTSPETRQRVMDAAAQLGYIPSESGRSLATRSTRRIAVLAEELTNPYYPALIEPLRRELIGERYRMVLVDGTTSFDDLADGSFDGVVITTATRDSQLPRQLARNRVPHVLLNRITDVSTTSTCSFDNASGAHAVADFMSGLGHQRVGAIHGPTRYSTGRDRGFGFAEGCAAAGIELDRRLVRRAEYDYTSARLAAIGLLEGTPRPTAVFCGNDVIAFGALGAARDLGLQVPRDLTIIGFDDIPMAAWNLIGLTTVRCDLAAATRQAIELLASHIAGTHRDVHTKLSVELVPRATHAGPPS